MKQELRHGTVSKTALFQKWYQGCGSGSWKGKWLIFCGSRSGSTLIKEVGSGSKLGSKSVEKELEAEANFSKSGASGFSTTVGVKCNNNNVVSRYITTCRLVV